MIYAAKKLAKPLAITIFRITVSRDTETSIDGAKL
jgi:hypothetical protein